MKWPWSRRRCQVRYCRRAAAYVDYGVYLCAEHLNVEGLDLDYPDEAEEA